MGLEKKCVADNGMAFGNAAGDFFVLDGAAKQHPIAAMANESVMAGPVYPAATVPVMEKSPAPIMTPTPSATRLQGPNTRFNDLLPV